MNRETKKDLVPQPADDSDLDLFVEGRHPGPVAVRGMFYLDLRGPYSSPWNKRAATVFAEAFIKSKRFVSTDFKLIEKKFKLHVRTITGHYDGQNGTGPKKGEKSQDQPDKRTRQVNLNSC